MINLSESMIKDEMLRNVCKAMLVEEQFPPIGNDSRQ